MLCLKDRDSYVINFSLIMLKDGTYGHKFDGRRVFLVAYAFLNASFICYIFTSTNYFLLEILKLISNQPNHINILL